MISTTFTYDINRSERAKQVQLLAPALAEPDSRWGLLSRLEVQPAISREESDASTAMHFVWVLRDFFTTERDEANKSKDWADLRKRWNSILDLPEWAHQPGWWRHPSGELGGDEQFVVHPCHRKIGWVSQAIQERIKRFNLSAPINALHTLTNARRTLNTECDCFIQKPNRIIVIECKDRTEFLSEQRNRQRTLFECLQRLLIRPYELNYVEVSQANQNQKGLFWSWKDIINARNGS